MKTTNPINLLTYKIIGAAIEVHNYFGPGFLEAVYHEAMRVELNLRKIPFESKPRIFLRYKCRDINKYYIPDFFVGKLVVVELKAQSMMGDVESEQAINSIKCCGCRVGILINFGGLSLNWRRFVNQY